MRKQREKHASDREALAAEKAMAQLSAQLDGCSRENSILAQENRALLDDLRGGDEGMFVCVAVSIPGY